MLELHACLLLLQCTIDGLHVGGKSALDWYGVKHYLSQQPVLQLYGWTAAGRRPVCPTAARLPDWFIERFPAEYHRKRLFDEPSTDPLHAGPFDKRSSAPRVSTPERALLEVLSEVGVRQPLQEARQLAESAYSLRTDALHELLQRCTSVRPCVCASSSDANSPCPGPASWTPRNCPPAAPGPECPAPPMGCLCSSHESDRPRHRPSAPFSSVTRRQSYGMGIVPNRSSRACAVRFTGSCTTWRNWRARVRGSSLSRPEHMRKK
jgi:transcriptional regulator with AbiEi antitoxin domain of type IV toxin-antitoxin system